MSTASKIRNLVNTTYAHLPTTSKVTWIICVKLPRYKSRFPQYYTNRVIPDYLQFNYINSRFTSHKGQGPQAHEPIYRLSRDLRPSLQHITFHVLK